MPHFLVTFTLPAELRALARSNQKSLYNLLFRASSQALLQLAHDPRFVGARLAMVGVLHTWSRQLLYHPHVGSGRGPWYLARSQALHFALSNAYFRSLGLPSLVDGC